MGGTKKALLVTTVSGFVPQFEMNNVRLLQERGYEVHYASNFDMPSYGDNNDRLKGTGICCHQIAFAREPWNLQNMSAVRELAALIRREGVSLLHCHTPMGAACARVAAARTGLRNVIYTAHGFHFFDGAPKKNWLIYYPVEKFLSRYTDSLLLINREDYARARKKFSARHTDLLPGVGIDIEAVQRESAESGGLREELGISPDKRVLLTAGEMIPRKNQALLLEVLRRLNHPSLTLIILGHGKLQDELKTKARALGVEAQVIFPGYRTDVFRFYGIADLFLFPSLQEGLPVAVMEAMAAGLPVVASGVRGNRDLILPGKGGELLSPHRATDWEKVVSILLGDCKKREAYGLYNRQRIGAFSREANETKMREIYARYDEA
ncbi:glycosyltransferase family 4 protein [Stomatobaculum longum]|uniref:glycosyltransferase family 4 protein n=1 Tax=Stomatobaculum longum TaxID=796942 RepID=UPI0028E605BC|nr:glycosyltransferase family 4 protein [Stomatobaculum longum]